MDEYAVSANWYDFIVGRPLASVFRRMSGLLAGQGAVLDICSGTGLLAEVFAGAGIPATGVDLSPAMLAVSRKKRPHIPVALADATALPFLDASFPAATLTFALHEKPEPVRQAIFREAIRVVGPHGLVVLADYRHPHGASRLGAWGVHCVERLAGGEHFANYRNWMRTGAAEGFLDRMNARWKLRRTALSGTTGLYFVSQS
ncbi:hypothetical protein JCM12178A_06370 [Salidesulfovibrio brasiliensis]